MKNILLRSLMPIAAAWAGLTGFYSCREHPELAQPADLAADDVLHWVDPMIGTGGFPWARGNVSPAAAAPFGRVRVGPDTVFFGKRTSTSGYGALDTHLLGFSHTRLSGTGAYEGGLLRILPATRLLESPGEFTRHQTVLDKTTERSTPGYYSVYLPGPHVQAELTATARTALHRYRFFQEGPRYLYLHLNSSLYGPGDKVSELSVETDVTQKRLYVRGRLKDAFSDRYSGLPFFFVIESESAWTGQRFFSNSQSTDQSPWAPPAHDGEAILRLDFGSAAAPSDLVLRVGLSYVAQSGAERVLSQENSGRTLSSLVQSTQSEWRDLLNRMQVEGGDERQKRIFYTALYHSFLMPTLMDDPNGGQYEYPGFDKVTHTAAHPFYSDLSLWDTFRTLHPLYNLILKDRHPDILSSLLLMSEQDHQLPRWPSGAGETGSMLGLPGLVVMSEAAQKNITGWDADLGFAWARKMTTPGAAHGQDCLADYVTLGYCPSLVSSSIEYAYAFEALSLWASARHESDLAAEAHARALTFKQHWSARRGFFVPKDADGKLDEGLSESDTSYLKLTRAGKYYIEGNAWHWAWSPFILANDIYQLSPGDFVERLERFFARSEDSVGSPWPVLGYWHGNEHDFHAAYMFAIAGRPDLTQKWVDFILRRKYQDKAMGLDGDDDGGAMSSWYVWSAMGLFPVAGTDRFILGSPIFDRVKVTLATGKALEITASAATGSPYVSGATLGDAAVAQPWVTEAQLAAGQTLHFERSTQPVRAWGNP